MQRQSPNIAESTITGKLCYFDLQAWREECKCECLDIAYISEMWMFLTLNSHQWSTELPKEILHCYSMNKTNELTYLLVGLSRSKRVWF